MKRLLLPLLAALSLPTTVFAHHDPNHNDQAKCTIKSEYNSDYRIEMYWPSTGLLLYKDELTRIKKQITSGRPTYFYGHST